MFQEVLAIRTDPVHSELLPSLGTPINMAVCSNLLYISQLIRDVGPVLMIN